MNIGDGMVSDERGWVLTAGPIKSLPYTFCLVFVEKTAIQSGCLAVVKKIDRPYFPYVVGGVLETEQPCDGYMVLFFACQG